MKEYSEKESGGAYIDGTLSFSMGGNINHNPFDKLEETELYREWKEGF